ncbi:hypothetical protein, partial [Paenibacillus hemerocallicola]|uniref:hypothetical protein n=1 Tax=Paenibacillus hemerocallicola TaxID=1172614 RepID=UPI001C404A62
INNSCLDNGGHYTLVEWSLQKNNFIEREEYLEGEVYHTHQQNKTELTLQNATSISDSQYSWNTSKRLSSPKRFTKVIP